MSMQDKVISRYLVKRHGTWIRGSKQQTLTIRPEVMEVCDATAREDSREYFHLKNVVKIVASDRSLDDHQ